jgi:YD repeat-containing protein
MALGVGIFALLSCETPDDGGPDPMPDHKPCASRAGSPRAWEGTLCNGNMQLVSLVSIDGVALVYNSVDSTHQEGFGYGWRLIVRSVLSRDELGNVTITRPDGTPVLFDYNGSEYVPEPLVTSSLSHDQGQDVFTETFLGGTRFIYRPFSAGYYYLEEMLDRNGNSSRIVRDGQGLEESFVDAWGRTTTFTFNGEKLESVTDAEGRTFSLNYNKNDELISITQPQVEAGVPVEQFMYDLDGKHFLITQVTPAGMVTDFTYYEDGSLKTKTSPTGFTMLVEYTKTSVTQKFSLGEQVVQHFENGELRSVTNDLGMSVDYTRDNRHRISLAGNHLGHTWEYRYNDKDDMTYEKNPMGQETFMEFDDNHNAVKVTQYGLTWSYQFNHLNQITQVTDPANETTVYERDANGNLLRIIDPQGKVLAQAEYYPDGTLKSMTNVYGDTTNIAYDGNGNISSLDHPSLGSVQLTSTPMGLVTEATSGTGDRTEYSYDGRGAFTGLMHRAAGTKGDPKVRTVSVGRDLDNRVTSQEYCGPDGCDTSSQELGPTGRVAKDEKNGTTVQDGECPCVEPPAPE